MVAAMAEGVSLRKTKHAVQALLPQAVLNWREARYLQKYGEIEMRLVDLLCRGDEDAIDVGANCGGYVHFMRRHARHVVAVEPVPEFARLLRAKFADDVIVEPIALSDRAGEVELYIPVIDGVRICGGSSIALSAVTGYAMRDVIRIRTARLDELYKGTVGFIKIDVEGHEQAVLEGAVATLRRCRPRLLIEIDERLSAGGMARTVAFLAGLGYRGYYVHAGRLHDIETFSAAALQKRSDMPDMTAMLRERAPLVDYVNNFIFLPLGEPAETTMAIRDRLARL